MFGPFPSPVSSTETHARTASPAAPGPSVQTQTAGGWGAMPLGPNPMAAASCQPEHIASDYPFASHYLDVFGSRMHYLDEGKGEPVLLVHGNATWSYVWRNVIPHLTPYARCIAPDLIGFGLSNKPTIEYRWAEQADYL